MVKLVDTLVLEASALCVTVRVRLEAPKIWNNNHYLLQEQKFVILVLVIIK